MSTEPTAFELLPAIDLRGGQVVRLERGDFARETAYDGDPLAVARRFAALGVTWLHVVDLDGARAGEPRQLDVAAGIVAETHGLVRVEVGGGLRTVEDVAGALGIGAARAAVGTAALRDPGFARELVERYGAARIVGSIDVRDGFALGEGWRPGAPGVPATDAVAMLADAGIDTFEVTAIERDGLLEGPDLDLLRSLVGLERGRIIASGGVSSIDDVLAVQAAGCGGAIVGKAIYESRIDLRALLDALDGLAST
ncbi:MAG TPA: 1-(5-phosphoribosyl)-5-[(5-phosphoribosylamino)methylideneamino] imidazole-4-carboxamide isomerase [Candidatus Limnocylindrales bacterium]|nr:1-(5-phosphoribosyl)-5-[(5-phosphoribosylamino)methylideneamino] imidazole-4-carboxamide isomerase [Candidatus Limnocylindrales bacterium]